MKLKRYFAAAVAILLLLSLLSSFDFGMPQRENMYYYLYATAPEEARDFEIAGKYYGNGAEYGVAIMLIDQLETGDYQAKVMWGYDATKYTEWVMTIHAQPDGRWSYNNCECSDITVDEKQNLDVEIRYTDGRGYFTGGNWCFIWDGAYETGCRSIIFEK